LVPTPSRSRFPLDQLSGAACCEHRPRGDGPSSTSPAARDRLLAPSGPREGRTAEELIFGSTAESPFTANRVQARADDAWEEAKLERVTPHECRHTFASLMIAAGVNAKALSTFMGNATITVTLDRYGHLMPGSEAEAAGLLDGYLTAQRKQAEEEARAADPVAA
jgi:integrase